jgi:cytochrome c553
MKRQSVCIAALVINGLGVTPSGAEEREPGIYGPPAANLSAKARRGEYLVRTGGCHDCHTPSKPGANGPVPDLSRMLSGHPQEVVIPSPPPLPAPWIVAAAAPMTAFAGPWGVSFSANLTPDRETGLGSWTERNFVEALRTGHHLGRGRPILPPMPWAMVREHSDTDLKAIFAYLQAIPAVKNRVPDPRPPAATPGPVGAGPKM